MWASQQELRKRAHEEEEEDELLRHIQLPGGTSAVCDDGENDGTGMMFANDVLQSVTKESEYYLDPIAPSVGGLGLNPNSDSLSVPCKDDPYQLPVPCATCCVSEQEGKSDEMAVDDIWGREPDEILDIWLRGGA